MRLLVQRVNHASVVVNGVAVASIQEGLLVYVGLAADDTATSATKLLDKLLDYRIFADEAGKMNLSLKDVDAELLLVSQFTLCAATNKGLRPDFKPAMAFAKAEQLFAQLVIATKQQHPKTQTGMFGADMRVVSENDGPINFLLE